jgi:predicted dehydrogenase
MKTRIAVIGTGIMGKGAVMIWQRHPGVEVVAVCDTDTEKASKVAAELSIPHIYASHRELLDKEQVDAVHVNTPDWAHRDPVIDSLNAGKHVLVEKPMTTDLTEADEIVRAVERTGYPSITTTATLVYHKVFSEIQKGSIGECLLGFAKKNNPILIPTEWLPWSGKSTSAWFLSSHDIDLMCWWTQAMGTEVYATGAKKVLVARGIDTYDAIQAQVRSNRLFATFICRIYSNESPYLPTPMEYSYWHRFLIGSQPSDGYERRHAILGPSPTQGIRHRVGAISCMNSSSTRSNKGAVCYATVRRPWRS